jgi:AcrR family transcriptional regulator
VAEIATRAGLTERTFFRHFADKREVAASLTSEAAIAVFRIAFERWINQTNQQNLPRLIRESLDALKAVTAGT